MMSFYQGRALRAEPRRGRRGGRLRRIAVALGVLGLLVVLAHLPWEGMKRRLAVVSRVRVQGTRYLDPEVVIRASGLTVGQDLFAIDLAATRRRLAAQPRIARAEVQREGLRTFRIRIEERAPVMLVLHGVPWEVDSSGVLLPPLQEGVVADVPLLTGAEFASARGGDNLRAVEVQRGLAWVAALGASDLQLAGQVSEVDVSDPHTTALLMMDGTRVLTPAWPSGTRKLSALRVVLADLKHRGTAAQEVDLRFDHQVIVRPAPEDGDAVAVVRSS